MNEETEKTQEFHRELMVLKADFEDLQKRMEDWSKRFRENYIESDDKLDRKET